MKKIKNNFDYIKNIILIIIIILCANFSAGGNKKITDTPEYVELQEGEGSFVGKIYDDNQIISVKNISFTGHTKIDGIKNADDDSSTRLDLSKIKEIEIMSKSHIPEKYQDREYILVKTISNNPAQTESTGFLVPREVSICAVDTTTNFEKSWYLRKLKKIVIEKEVRTIGEQVLSEAQTDAEKAKQNNGIIKKIKTGIQKAVDYINP